MRFDDNSTFLRTIAGRPFLGEGCGCVPLIIYTRSDLMLIAWLFLSAGSSLPWQIFTSGLNLLKNNIVK
jgi:hypothetical protein